MTPVPVIDPQTEEPTDAGFEVADKLERALVARPGGTPSRYARTAGCDTTEARQLLDWMVEHRLAYTEGNGAWKHYHPGRGW